MPNWWNIIKPVRSASNMWRPSTWMNMSDWKELIKSRIIISCSITFSRRDFAMSSHIIIVNHSYNILGSNLLNYLIQYKAVHRMLESVYKTELSLVVWGCCGCFSTPGIWGFRKEDRKRSANPDLKTNYTINSYPFETSYT